MDEQRDNSNRGALWSARGFAGTLDIEGNGYFVLMIETRSTAERVPAYKMLVRWAKDNREDIVPVWRDKDGSKRVGHADYMGHWISIFVNDQKGNDRAPLLRLSATKKESKPTDNVDDEPLPF